MRTRLDDIVEDEARKHAFASDWKKWGWPFASHIAERAFRHGVEQGQTAAIHATNFLDAVNPEEFSYKVQPAPAEEKRCTTCGAPVHSNNPICTDRRKAERRRVRANGCFRLDALNTRRQMYFDVKDKLYLWRDDRRTGKDRRRD